MAELKPPKPKAINYELIPEMDGDHEPEPYKILKEIRAKYHTDIEMANIALAWRKSLKPDKDGHLMLGMCVKVSDLNKELQEYDFIILLNREVWLSDEFTPDKKKALIDHELCHATFAPDKDGFIKHDERDRIVWRTRKHDIEEFLGVVSRHGCYKRDLVAFADALMKKKATPPLVAQMEKSTERMVLEIPESNAEERAREKKRKRLRGQNAMLPDPRPPQPGAQP